MQIKVRKLILEHVENASTVRWIVQFITSDGVGLWWPPRLHYATDLSRTEAAINML